ncbi:MAG: FMN-binding protein [Phycisphaerae bacterium]|nr:FMN-binding protein [Phycisphaerae bacterium]NIP55158.1 FMN-binding protein [Phycisphaerae bacterium]NIS53570.1 FMN-binding protein [Phycisphaerae bacterium]NIU11462.1 FMN-binding protein [Phycisphaerae bacterium]NIU55543.1 FMN-binding protein [Phycisphaerae bacterium]
MSKIRYFIKQSWLLILSSFCFGLLLAIANAAWYPRILQNEKEKLNKLIVGLVSDANDFQIVIEDVNIPGERGKIIKTDIYKVRNAEGKTAGFAFVGIGSGFADKIKLVITIDSKCEKFLGFDVLSSNETPGFGDKIKEKEFRTQFKGIVAGNLEIIKAGEAKNGKVMAISGATVSSESVVKIFNIYIDKITQKIQEAGLD